MNALVQAASPDGDAVIGTAQQVADLVATFAFGVSGALLAVRKGYDFIGLSALAFATAFGSGVIRDLLANRTPPVLRPDQDLYTVPAIIGATTSALLLHFDSYNTLTGGAAFLVALSVRLLALRFHWHTTVAVAKTLRRPKR
ncbi:TRIC cation channel family protein [Streptomyces bacillaris]